MIEKWRIQFINTLLSAHIRYNNGTLIKEINKAHCFGIDFTHIPDQKTTSFQAKIILFSTVNTKNRNNILLLQRFLVYKN